MIQRFHFSSFERTHQDERAFLSALVGTIGRSAPRALLAPPTSDWNFGSLQAAVAGRPWALQASIRRPASHTYSQFVDALFHSIRPLDIPGSSVTEYKLTQGTQYRTSALDKTYGNQLGAFLATAQGFRSEDKHSAISEVSGTFIAGQRSFERYPWFVLTRPIPLGKPLTGRTSKYDTPTTLLRPPPDGDRLLAVQTNGAPHNPCYICWTPSPTAGQDRTQHPGVRSVECGPALGRKTKAVSAET